MENIKENCLQRDANAVLMFFQQGSGINEVLMAQSVLG